MSTNINDPAYSDLVDVATNVQSNGLQISVINLAEGDFNFTSSQGLADNAYAIICHGINIFNEQFNLKKWAKVNILDVNTLAGYAPNAFYDRTSLKFFYFADKNGDKIYTALSSDIVSHELGHALLDAIKPEMFNAASIETWAFHEAFGDINSIICALYHDKLIDYVLTETKTDLRKSNIISRVAEQMGVALSKPFSLREAANALKYVNPDALLNKKTIDPNELTKEPHNFSRVMTGTFYEILCCIYEKLGKNKNALIETREYLKKTFYQACMMAPCTSNFFEAFGLAWIKTDQKQGGTHQDILVKVFQDRNIFRAQMLSIEDKEQEQKDRVSTIEQDNMRLEKCKMSISIKDLFADDFSGLDNDNIANMKVQLAVDELYLNDDVVTWQNCCDPVAKAKIAAKGLVKYIFDNNQFGDDENHIWHKDADNNLIRKMFQCDCFMPNYLFPGNPEYNKPYKQKNNSGCCSYGSCGNTDSNPPVVVVKNCNIRYGGYCGSISYNGICKK